MGKRKITLGMFAVIIVNVLMLSGCGTVGDVVRAFAGYSSTPSSSSPSSSPYNGNTGSTGSSSVEDTADAGSNESTNTTPPESDWDRANQGNTSYGSDQVTTRDGTRVDRDSFD